MKKYITVGIIFVFMILVFARCSAKYHEKDFIGKTSEEIISEFGDFDCISMPAGEDGLYRNCRCGYTVKESAAGFFGKTEEVLFFITFDENGIAIECGEDYRPGG